MSVLVMRRGHERVRTQEVPVPTPGHSAGQESIWSGDIPS